jgi:hypothetical protein
MYHQDCKKSRDRYRTQRGMYLPFCVACGDSDPEHLQHHHLVPRARGGSDDDANQITLCVSCHGKLHGRELSNEHRALVVEGQRRARAAGKRLGNPPVPEDVQRDIEARFLAGQSKSSIVGFAPPSDSEIPNRGKRAQIAVLDFPWDARRSPQGIVIVLSVRCPCCQEQRSDTS